MVSTKKIIILLNPTDFQELQTRVSNSLIVIKFGAEWCNPCKTIKPICEQWYKTCPPNIIYADIDIDKDENVELYQAFRNKKMIKGVPTIFAFDMRKSRDHWYIPDDSVIGGDIVAVTKFFERCSNAVL